MIFIIAGRHFRAIIGPGSRTAFTWFDTTVSEPFKVAAAGNGVYAARTVNYTVGAGPHFGVALDYNFAQPGLSFLTNLDIADTFTCIRQRFSTATTTLTPAGRPAKGEFQESFFWNEVPILNFYKPAWDTSPQIIPTSTSTRATCTSSGGKWGQRVTPRGRISSSTTKA